MRRPGRFELKILAAILLGATLALGVSGYALLTFTARVEDFLGTHQREVGASLARPHEVFKAYFADRKEAFRQIAAWVTANPPAHAEELSGLPDLLEARLVEGSRVVEQWTAPADAWKVLRAGPPIPAVVGGDRIIELTFGIPSDLYARFLELRAAMDRESDRGHALLPALEPVRRAYALVAALLVVFAVAIGLLVARRATGRLAALGDAARRVGQGDLSVRLAPRGRDELDDLGRAFDRMVAELGEARSRLEYLQKVSAWQEVARRLAHEIKNPLTPIQLAMQQLASKYQGDDPAFRRLLDSASEIMKEEIGALRRLVDDFSAFAKLPRVAPEPVDVAELVDDFVRSHAEFAAWLAFERPGAPVPGLCDKMLIRRVLANLVENAVHAAQGAGREPRVCISLATLPKSRAAIIIDDNGPGIPEAERERVFDPYYTTKEHGTGLGLAIVRKVVIDHGGDVVVEAAPAPLGGARFVVKLPASRERQSLEHTVPPAG